MSAHHLVNKKGIIKFAPNKCDTALTFFIVYFTIIAIIILNTKIIDFRF